MLILRNLILNVGANSFFVQMITAKPLKRLGRKQFFGAKAGIAAILVCRRTEKKKPPHWMRGL